MKKFVYRKVDAFVSGASRGNPAAYILTGGICLTDAEMLAFGREHAGFASEVVIVAPSEIADMKMTYWSSECEVAFCGHGTVATLYDLLSRDSELRKKPIVTIETNRKGVLSARNALASDDAVFISAPKPRVFTPPVSAAEAAAALGGALGDMPVGFIDAGLRTLIVNMKDFGTEVNLRPDIIALGDFCVKNGVDIVLAFCMETENPARLAHTRVFAPRFGYLEDPATGSGSAAFGKYLLDAGAWDGRASELEQGGSNIEYNAVKLLCENGEILFGGRARARIEGFYLAGDA